MFNFKKIFILILIIFLLNSCSGIKIVIEKDCNCENKNTLQSSSSDNLKEENHSQNLIKKIKKPELLRYLTGKFTVNQNDENTYVYYKDKMVFKVKNDVSSFGEDDLDEKPMIKEDVSILKRELAKKISVKNIKTNIYIIELENALKNSKVLVDISENKSWNIDFVKSPFEKIIFGRSGKYLMYSGTKDCNGGLIYINNNSQKLKKVFENDCDYVGDYPESYKEIKSFSLGDGVIKVNYVDNFGDKEVEEIELESIK